MHGAAARGVAGSGASLPHLERIQGAFGHHDVSKVQAFQGGQASAACRAIGAEAYATGDRVAFAGAPSLHTAAHEAAHVVQQRAGVSLRGAVGESADRYEQHADAVADMVVQGKSAAPLLDRMAGTGGGAAVQRKDADEPLGLVLEDTDDRITGWSAAQDVIGREWTAIGDCQVVGIDSAYYKIKSDDPPPLWHALLRAAVEISIDAVTAGVGSKIVNAVVNRVGKHVAAAIVKAGQSTVKAVVSEVVNAAFEAHPSDVALAFTTAQKTAAIKVAKKQANITSAKSSQLRTLPEAEGWRGLQELYNAVFEADADATKKATDETIFAWLSALAQAEYGQAPAHEGDPKTDTTGLYSAIDTSSVGTIGLRLVESSDPVKPLRVSYCEMESSKGNNERVREYLLNSQLPLAQMRVPKVILGTARLGDPFQHALQGLAGQTGIGIFEIAFDESNAWTGLAMDASRKTRSGNPGREFLAMYGMRTDKALGDQAIEQGWTAGVDRMENDLLGKTFKQLGITSMST